MLYLTIQPPILLLQLLLHLQFRQLLMYFLNCRQFQRMLYRQLMVPLRQLRQHKRKQRQQHLLTRLLLQQPRLLPAPLLHPHPADVLLELVLVQGLPPQGVQALFPPLLFLMHPLLSCLCLQETRLQMPLGEKRLPRKWLKPKRKRCYGLATKVYRRISVTHLSASLLTKVNCQGSKKQQGRR